MDRIMILNRKPILNFKEACKLYNNKNIKIVYH